MLNRLRDELSVLCFSCVCVVILEITFISTGISYGQSNSDIEALHQAYCHIAHSLGDADEQRTESNAAENIYSGIFHPSITSTLLLERLVAIPRVALILCLLIFLLKLMVLSQFQR